MSWFNSVEFYVIAGTIAAAVVALASVPARRGAAAQHLLAGVLSEPDAADDPEAPTVTAEVDSRGRVIITRRGLPDIAMTGAVSLAVEVAGFDITVKERLTPGRGDHADLAGHATFILDFLAPERYHISYRSEILDLVAAFTLPVRPGIKVTRDLK